MSKPFQLLAPEEPKPSRLINPKSDTPILLVCDHASNRIPKHLTNLGLAPENLDTHLAVDIGTAPLTEILAEELGLTAILAQYSRLVIDCNRTTSDPGAFLSFGDGISIPGNQALSSQERQARIDEIHAPYHQAIDRQIDRLASPQSGPHHAPAFISIHSFTPILNGGQRPWQLGVLWDKDPSLPQLFIKEFRQAGYVTGDNQPYSGRAPEDYTVDSHAEARGIPHVAIEVRQDLISDSEGIHRIAELMKPIIRSIPELLGWRTEIGEP